MTAPAPYAPFEQVFQLGIGFTHSRALHTLIELGIPMFLKNENKSLEEIAAHCEAHPVALFRFLRYLSVLGLVKSTATGFRLSESGQLLRSDVPGNLVRGLELLTYEPWQKSW